MRSFIQRYLDPTDSLLEIIYGVLIVMTFTLAFRAFDASTMPVVVTTSMLEQQVQRLFVAAFGCTIAWGIIDGVIYVLTSMAERAANQRLIGAVNAAPDADKATDIIAGELDEKLGPVSTDAARQALYDDIRQQVRVMQPLPQGLKRDDVFGAIGLVLAAIVATLPVVIPFLFVRDPFVAIRTSNLVAILMLFLVGYRWAKLAGGKPIRIGLLLAGIGVVIVLIAIPLGG